MKTKSRILAALMAFIMIAGMLPISAFAEGEATPPANEAPAQTQETTAPTTEPTPTPAQNTTTLPEPTTTPEQNTTTTPEQNTTTTPEQNTTTTPEQNTTTTPEQNTTTLSEPTTTQQPQADEQAPATPMDSEPGELPGSSEDKKKDDNGDDSVVPSETQQDPAPEQVVSALEASPMLRSTRPSLNAPLQNADTLDIVGIVNWNDDNNEQHRPEIIMVRLLANNTEHASQEVKAGSSGLWAFEFNNLPAANAQGAIDYTITVDEIPEYMTKVEKGSGTNFVITNTLNGFVSVDYVTPEGDTAHAVCKVVTAADTVWDEGDSKYYAVTSNVTLENRVTVKGSVILILGDDTELNAPYGLNVEKENNASLEIVAEATKQNGKLTAQGGKYQAGIGGGEGRDGGTIIITGGFINATGGERGAGIGGGMRSSSTEVIIYGGDITATGGGGAGIGGGLAKNANNPGGSGGIISIYGGTVRAISVNRSAGIGGGAATTVGNNGGAGGNVAIYGGTVIASSVPSDTHAIGSGSGNNDDGTLTVYNEAVVHSGRLEGSAQPVSETDGTNDRVNACRSPYARISPCTNHSYTVFKDITKTTHTPICGYCTHVGEPEVHSYGDDDTCACGARQYTVTVANGTADKTKAAAGEIVTITANPPEKGKAFVQWPHIDGVDYAQTDSVTTTFTMPAKDVELTPVYADILIPDIADQTYTGEAITPRFSFFSGVRLDGVDKLLVQGMHYDVTYDKNIDAGEATLIVTMKAPSEGSKSATFQILPVDIEVTTGSATKDVYDGTPLTCQTGAEITGLLSGETATVRATGSQTDVGTSDNTYEIEWGTAKAGNYNVAKESLGTLTVTSPKAVTVTANDASKTYGEDDPDLTATVTGLVGSDTVSYTLSRDTGEDAGTYAITPTGEAAQGNYTVSFAPGTFTIEKAPLPLDLSIEGWTVGETANAPILTGNTGNGAVTYEYKLKTADEAAYGKAVPTAAGDYTVRATVEETSNYKGGAAAAEFTVSPAPPTPVTVTEIKPETTPPSPTYEATVQAVTWQKGSEKTIDLTIKRSENDHLTYGLFGSLEIGGVTVGSANYGAAEGSLKLSIKPEYLETLAVGDHTVKVNFRDGSATVKLTVLAAATQPQKLDERRATPNTGDESNLALWSSLMFLSVAGMLVVAVAAKRRRKER